MKNPNRIRRNGVKAKLSVQSQTKPASDKITPSDQVSVSFNSAEGINVGDVIDLAPDEWKAIQSDASKRGEMLGEWLNRTLAETPALQSVYVGVKKKSAPSSAGSLFRDMEIPINKTVALLRGFGKEIESYYQDDEGVLAYEGAGFAYLGTDCGVSLIMSWKRIIVLDDVLDFGRLIAETTELLELMGERLSELHEDERYYAAKRLGQEPPKVGPDGIILMAKRICSELQSSFDAAFKQFDELTGGIDTPTAAAA